MSTDDSSKPPSSATVLVELVKWSKGLPSWQRDALRRLYEHLQLTDTDISELLMLCKDAHKLLDDSETAPEFNPLAASHVPTGDTADDRVALLSLSDVCNVNALIPKQTLSFRAEGLSVIYGNNGSGKSGYTRVLKKLCRARMSEDILYNVYDSKPSDPASATVEFQLGANKQSPWKWTDGTTPLDDLSLISVFDSKCATVHVEKDNPPAYLPLPLQLLGELAQACLSVKGLLQIGD